jgi:hypothetical protein
MQMLSDDCFNSEFLGFLCTHFNKEIKHDRILEAYREAFDRYSDATFTELCGMAFRECKFLPEPQWFAERAVTIAAKILAEAESFAALPSAEMRELETMTDEERAANIRRLRKMMGECW